MYKINFTNHETYHRIVDNVHFDIDDCIENQTNSTVRKVLIVFTANSHVEKAHEFVADEIFSCIVDLVTEL